VRFVVDLLQPLGQLSWPWPYGFFEGAVGGLDGAFGYTLAFTAWGQWVILSRLWLPLSGKLPWNTTTFLSEAYRLGVLRQAGAFYQFSHDRLQRHLSQTYSAGR
jgi:hypothetical protein